ncbi:uncharacterized protein LOC121295870 [Polyodon spathula]|uniref:uncharacterized protein LOC121295870 n=1 Tax=Polyodon spathula TaxID=7913 RepID=UPI001B7DD585|nr:uncharacterized protein LOC121295870 [Polyodon spathula]XP_041076921.1 uncharacterized protein LOC121295870 [Polyodon spathula]
MESYPSFYLLSFLALTKTAHTVEQTPQFVRAQPGQSATISCKSVSKNFDGLYLRRFIQNSEVLYIHKSGKTTIDKNYTHLIKTEGDAKNCTITINNLTESNSDVYFCQFVELVVETGNITKVPTTGTLIVVQDEVKKVTCPLVDPNPPSSSLQLTSTLMIVTSLAAVCVLMLCIIALIIWQLPNIKKCFAKRRFQQAKQDTIYEDMSQQRYSH